MDIVSLARALLLVAERELTEFDEFCSSWCASHSWPLLVAGPVAVYRGGLIRRVIELRATVELAGLIGATPTVVGHA